MKDRCNARTRSGGNCRRWPLAGGTRCKLHGGASPRAKAAAQRRLVEADARAALAYEGIKPVDDPVLELSRLANEIVGMKQALAARVNALDSPVFTDAFGNENIRAEVKLFNESLDRCVKVLSLLGQYDLDARLVQVTEDTGALFRLVIEGVLAGLALTPEQSAQVPELMSTQLRLASEGVRANALPTAS